VRSAASRHGRETANASAARAANRCAEWSMADDFFSGTRAAIAGGNTTVLPFALQPRGKSLRASVMEYHKEADGKCLADYGFHLIITDPSASVLGQELPALVEDGYSSFKVFMTYDDLVLNDRNCSKCSSAPAAAVRS
jgi:dihydroorotase-like cyclic amidohydrolase